MRRPLCTVVFLVIVWGLPAQTAGNGLPAAAGLSAQEGAAVPEQGPVIDQGPQTAKPVADGGAQPGSNGDVYANYRDPEAALLPVLGDEATLSPELRLGLGLAGAGFAGGGVTLAVLGFSGLFGQLSLNPDLLAANSGGVGAAAGMLLAALGTALISLAAGN